jgi:hypothetical protein
MSCARCEDLCRQVPIRTPGELEKVALVAKANLDDGTDLGHSSDGPSWFDPDAIRVNLTESRLAACLNRLLQQNRHEADVFFLSVNVGYWGESGGGQSVFRCQTHSLGPRTIWG